MWSARIFAPKYPLLGSLILLPNTGGKVRICANLKPLNEIIERSRFVPAPRSEEFQDKLRESSIFGSVDIKRHAIKLPLMCKLPICDSKFSVKVFRDSKFSMKDFHDSVFCDSNFSVTQKFSVTESFPWKYSVNQIFPWIKFFHDSDFSVTQRFFLTQRIFVTQSFQLLKVFCYSKFFLTQSFL